MIHAGVYSSALHFFNALEAAGSKDAEAVMEEVRSMPVDLFGEEAVVREDGRMVHDMYLVRVKSPEESEGDWDYYEILRTIPGDEAFRPMEEGDCPHVGG
jgi:branched-chain amino acid transport system substrate-binding protein